jgi:hypothetical protein
MVEGKRMIIDFNMLKETQKDSHNMMNMDPSQLMKNHDLMSSCTSDRAIETESSGMQIQAINLTSSRFDNPKIVKHESSQFSDNIIDPLDIEM